MKKKKVLLILIALMLLSTGCSKKAVDTSDQSLKGRYVEKNLAIPEEIGISAIVGLTKKDNMPFLYGFDEDPYAINGYRLNSDGTWTEATPSWLKSLSLPEGWSYRPLVFEDANGYQYFYYTESINDSLKSNLLRSTDGSTYEILQPEGWNEKDPDYGNYNSPANINILEDGTLVALYYGGEVVFYDKTDFSIQNTITGTQYSGELLSVMGQSVILRKCDENGNTISIDVYDASNNYSKTSYPFESNINGYSYCDSNEKKDLLLCNADGIHILENSTSLWNTVVDGTLTSLTMQNMWYNGFVSDSDDNYYVLYNSGTGFSLMKYTYDATIDTVPSTVLNIYSLQDSSTLRQAAAIFQQSHSDVKVDFTIAMTAEEFEAADATVKQDYIRALNTELLAGGGYDILVLDGLPTDSFIEKGVLTDISDIIQPMIDSGTLYPNIMNNYVEDGKIYHVPARFRINLLCGRTADAKALTSLDALADYAAKHMNTSLFGNMTPEDFIHVFSPYLKNKIMGSDGKINREKLITVLNELKAIRDNCGFVEEYSEEKPRGNSIWNIVSSTYLNLDSYAGFLDAMLPFGIVTYSKGSYTSFESSFTPICELGINNASSNQELCKEFINLVLSEDIQKNDLYDGFSVNTGALFTCSQSDRSGYAMTTEIENEDGSYSMITFNTQTKEQLADIVAICSSITTKTVCDDQLVAAFLEETKEFFGESETAKVTADAIIQKLDVYLSE
jgi:hypothetical protein